MHEVTNDANGEPVSVEFPEPEHLDPEARAALGRYWLANVRIMQVLLAVWAVVGLGCGVLFADWLNSFRLGGYPLGFWFAQQGAIVVFVLLILVYALLLNRLDAAHHAEVEELERRRRGSAEGGGAA